MNKVVSLIFSDIRNIRRDGLLLLSMIGPIVLALVIRYVVPWVDQAFLHSFDFQLGDHHSFMLAFLCMMAPIILGTLSGFIILDERDEHILHYFAVTPLSRFGYLLFRLASSLVLSVVFTFFALALAGVKGVALLHLIVVTLLASLEAPMMAMFMGAFANNKVEGLALSKATGVVFVGPIIGYVVETQWQFLGGVFPPYWVSEAFLASYHSPDAFWFYATIGFVVHIGILILLLKRFVHKAL